MALVVRKKDDLYDAASALSALSITLESELVNEALIKEQADSYSLRNRTIISDKIMAAQRKLLVAFENLDINQLNRFAINILNGEYEEKAQSEYENQANGKAADFALDIYSQKTGKDINDLKK